MEIIPKKEIKETLQKLFQNSKDNIKISSAWIKGQILKELIEKSPKNIKIELIIRASSVDDLLITDEVLFKLVNKKNIEIYLYPDLHSKFFIFDNKISVLGSSNLTFSGIEVDEGNIETDILIDNENQIKELLEVFNNIKENSTNIKDIAGFILNSTSSSSANFLVLNENLVENSFLTFKKENKFVISRIATLSSVPVNSFYTLDSTIAKPILENIERLSKLFINKDKNWKKAALFGYFNDSEYVKIANLEILGIYDENVPPEESLLKPLNEPIETGSFGIIEKNIIEKVFSTNHAGYKMNQSVEFGEVLNLGIPAKIDFEKIASMHMAVLGTTGSGKTTFVRRLLENLNIDTKVFILDIFNEYRKSLKNTFIVDIPSTIFPLTYENLKKLFKDYGITFEERTKEEKEVAGYIKRNLKPDVDFIGYKDKNLENIIYNAASLIKTDLVLKAELIYFLEILKSDFGKDVIRNQTQILNSIKKALKTKEKFVIFNFENIEDINSKINIAGLILKEIFKIAKKEFNRYVVVLEEAQNFAPEKIATDVPVSSENLAYIMAKKIAMEGRKFNLGLIAITQRPANISKYVLSQLNTQVILKLVNKNDLDAVSIFFEANKQQIFNSLPYLKPGYLYITGLAVPFGYISKIKLG